MAHKLLLADDSPTIQRVVELTFANEDVDVVAVGDGARAIAAIEDDEPDIVLADVGMPGTDGYEVASFVRRDAGRARIPVVLLTGAFEPLDAERCDEIGRHDVLIKPFEPRELVGKVRALLDPSAPPDPPPPDARDAAGAEAPESAEDGTETPAGEGEGANGEARAAEDDTDAGGTPVAAVAPAEDARAGRSTGGASDPPPTAGAENAASPAEPGDPPSPPAERAVEDEAVSPPAGERTPGGAGPPAGAGGSVLAQAFVTFLAAEQGAAPPAPPAADLSGASGGAKPVLPEAVMDELVDRVVERLTDTVLRDTVAEVVSRLAERLGRDEVTRVPPGRE